MARTSGSKTREYPVHTLEQTLVIIQAIADKGAGQAMDRLLVADGIGRTPSSSEFKRLLSSSLRYGLTAGTEKADHITPTPLGLRITKPQSTGEHDAGLVEACLKPEIMGRILRHFNRNKIPDEKFLKNTLERTFEIDASQSDELGKLLLANARFVGVLQKISGAEYLRIDAPRGSTPGISLQSPGESPAAADADSDPAPVTPLSNVNGAANQIDQRLPEAPRKPRKLFIAHGKNRKPLESLKKILDQFKIPYAVAVDEAHKGRPISAKVAELMKDCSAGVFIFTKDERFKNDKDDDIWRPSENVVYELGAANVMWDRKIIILRQDGVNFPSDFSDLGYIKFDGDELGEKTVDILKELVGLDLVKIQAV